MAREGLMLHPHRGAAGVWALIPATTRFSRGTHVGQQQYSRSTAFMNLFSIKGRYPMARPILIQILERARALIADEQHWCRGQLALDARGVGVFATSASAVKRCALGAVIAATYELTHDFDAAHDLAHKALHPYCGTATLIHVNDMRGHAAVLRLFNQVIKAQKSTSSG